MFTHWACAWQEWNPDWHSSTSVKRRLSLIRCRYIVDIVSNAKHHFTNLLQEIYPSLIPTLGFFTYQCKLRLTLFCISELTLAEFSHSVLNIVKSFLWLVLFSSYLHMQEYHPLHNQVSIYIRTILEYSHIGLVHGRKTNLTNTRLHLFETI